MATSNIIKMGGYQCEFLESVNDLFYCKECDLVARKVTITTCCGESFCDSCITSIHQQGQPCPECGEKGFVILEQLKYRQRIGALNVYCSMKDRGCDWSGTIDQLDTHLDPELDNCQHKDTKCPLHCQQLIPKNKLEKHLTQDCSKRVHICQYCGYKATYEEVVGTHFVVCKCLPLQCPNKCGVSCDREEMIYHIKLCSLEEVKCVFSSVGCDEKFTREGEDEHMKKSVNHHLTLTSSLTAEMKTDMEQNIAKLEQKVCDHECKIIDNELKHRKEIQALQDKLIQQEKKFMKLFAELFKCSRDMWTFEMNNYKSVTEKHQFWKGPAMYTHIGGYKFFIGFISYAFKLVHIPNSSKESSKRTFVDYMLGREDSSIDRTFVCGPEYLHASIHIVRGEHSEELKWPVRLSCTVELVNQKSGEHQACTLKCESDKPCLLCEEVVVASNAKVLVETSLLTGFCYNDTLCFRITNLIVK